VGASSQVVGLVIVLVASSVQGEWTKRAYGNVDRRHHTSYFASAAFLVVIPLVKLVRRWPGLGHADLLLVATALIVISGFILRRLIIPLRTPPAPPAARMPRFVVRTLAEVAARPILLRAVLFVGLSMVQVVAGRSLGLSGASLGIAFIATAYFVSVGIAPGLLLLWSGIVLGGPRVCVFRSFADVEGRKCALRLIPHLSALGQVRLLLDSLLEEDWERLGEAEKAIAESGDINAYNETSKLVRQALRGSLDSHFSVEDGWKDQVLRWLEDADGAVFVLTSVPSENLRWEIDACLARVGHRRVFFLCTSGARTSLDRWSEVPHYIVGRPRDISKGRALRAVVAWLVRDLQPRTAPNQHTPAA